MYSATLRFLSFELPTFVAAPLMKMRSLPVVSIELRRQLRLLVGSIISQTGPDQIHTLFYGTDRTMDDVMFLE